MRWLIALSCALACEFAHGRAGTGDGNAKFKSAKTLDGFCTDTNEDEPYYKEGYCQSLSEQFTNNQCMKDTVEKLRKEYIGQGQKQKDGTRKTVNLGFECSADPYAEGKDLRTVAQKNPSQFSYVLMQWIAMLTAQQSGWDVLKDESNGGKGPGGLLNLSLEKDGDRDMENKDYECACKERVATTSGQSGVTVEGQSPGPLDGHHSLTCGAYMILSSIEKDSGSGKESDPDKPNAPKKSKGVTRILPDVDPDPDSEDKKAVAANKWRKDKMQTFCNQFFKSSQTNPWNRQLTNDLGDGDLKTTAPKSDTSQ